ncbi:MAG: helix-turn-helix transcriptional regulator, partial [Clostridia bacterium]|nr:helix-turn-helix transcriptional regulator [Clostridia bacterium]
KSRLYLLIHQILQSQKEQKDTLLDQIILLLEQELPIGEIAYQCSISESGLRRLFAKQFGISPVVYRTQLKIQKACRMLISTDLTIGEIADTLNFFDEAYFCKVFRKQTGLSPTCYRNEHQIIL